MEEFRNSFLELGILVLPYLGDPLSNIKLFKREKAELFIRSFLGEPEIRTGRQNVWEGSAQWNPPSTQQGTFFVCSKHSDSLHAGPLPYTVLQT